MNAFTSRYQKQWWSVIKPMFLLMLSLFVITMLSACLSKPPLKVAVMTKLESGSIIGSSEVDAALMFLKSNNIRTIEIIPFNDAWEPERVKAAYEEARKQGINVFITSHTSTCAVELKALTDLEQDDVLILVTGSTTTKLSGLDDNNIRFVQDLSIEQRSIGKHIVDGNYKHLLILRDLDNHRYTEPALETFLSVYPGKYTLIDFSIKTMDMEAINTQLKGIPFDAVYTLIGGNQSASGTLAQMAYNINPQVKVYFTPWNNGATILETAGSAIDNCIMANHYNFSDPNSGVAAYFEDFKKEYQYSPTYNSLHVYKSLEVLSEALKAGNTNPVKIKEYMIKTKEFETRFGIFQIDEYGDANLPLFFIDNIEDVY